MKTIENVSELLTLINYSSNSGDDITYELHRISDDLRDDEFAIFVIAKSNGARYADVAFDLATDRVRESKAFITLMASAGFGKDALIVTNFENRNDPELMLEVIVNNFDTVRLLGPKLLNDKKFIMKLAKIFGDRVLPIYLSLAGHCPFVTGGNINDFKFNDTDIIEAVERGKEMRKGNHYTKALKMTSKYN